MALLFEGLRHGVHQLAVISECPHVEVKEEALEGPANNLESGRAERCPLGQLAATPGKWGIIFPAIARPVYRTPLSNTEPSAEYFDWSMLSGEQIGFV